MEKHFTPPTKDILERNEENKVSDKAYRRWVSRLESKEAEIRRCLDDDTMTQADADAMRAFLKISNTKTVDYIRVVPRPLYRARAKSGCLTQAEAEEAAYQSERRRYANAKSTGVRSFYKNGRITEEQMYKHLNDIKNGDLEFVKNFNLNLPRAPGKRKVREIAEENEGRALTDKEFDEWTRTRIRMMARLNVKVAAGELTEDLKRVITLELDGQNLEGMRNFNVQDARDRIVNNLPAELRSMLRPENRTRIGKIQARLNRNEGRYVTNEEYAEWSRIRRRSYGTIKTMLVRGFITQRESFELQALADDTTTSTCVEFRDSMSSSLNEFKEDEKRHCTDRLRNKKSDALNSLLDEWENKPFPVKPTAKTRRAVPSSVKHFSLKTSDPCLHKVEYGEICKTD